MTYAYDSPYTISGTLSVEEAAATRRSIRSYVDTPMDKEDLDAIIDIARRAPSAYNVQPWRFIAITNPALKHQLSQAAYGQRQVDAAPCLLVMYTDMANVLAHLDEISHPNLPPEAAQSAKEMIQSSYGTMPEASRELWGQGQGYIALGYLLLAATAMGYGTSPMLGFDPEAVKRILSLPTHVQIPALVSIGRPAEDGFPQHRHPLGRILSYRE